jgi:hypothetical protein
MQQGTTTNQNNFGNRMSNSFLEMVSREARALPICFYPGNLPSLSIPKFANPEACCGHLHSPDSRLGIVRQEFPIEVCAHMYRKGYATGLFRLLGPILMSCGSS